MIFFSTSKTPPETTELLNVIGDDHEKRNLRIWQANLRYQTENLPTAEKENITCMDFSEITVCLRSI